MFALICKDPEYSIEKKYLKKKKLLQTLLNTRRKRYLPR